MYNFENKNLNGILPDNYFLDGESLISIENLHREIPTDIPSSLKQLMLLTNATIESEIGKFGPSKASRSINQNAPEHLRLYETLFGRDSLRVASDLIPLYPELARTTILELARLQGVRYNFNGEEEPGRILHEARSPDDPIAKELTKNRGWGWPYYGSVDATPEFVRTLVYYCNMSEENTQFLAEEYLDRANETRSIAYALDMAVEWILKRLDSNPEGLLEFKSILKLGIENQVWKDSWDAYHHSDGTIANHNKGIASIEVQASTYEALVGAANIYEDILNQPDKANNLRWHASVLKTAILDNFWTEEKGGYFVLGTDRSDNASEPRQLKIRTSNMGHILNCSLLGGNNPDIKRMRDSVVVQLFTPEMQTVNGIRTLASDEVRFRPGAYHNGSIWIWDNYAIASGLARHGYTEQANIINHKILKIIADTHIFPEYVRGDNSEKATTNKYRIKIWDTNSQQENTVEQPPQEVQAWTVASVLAIKYNLGKVGLAGL